MCYTHKRNCRQRTGKTLNACSRSPLADNTVVGGNCIFVCVRACVCVCAQMGMDYTNTWLCMSCLTVPVSQIPRQHLLHSAKVLGPAFVALLRKEIAFQMLFALVFFPPLDRAALTSHSGALKRSVSFHAPLFSFSKSRAKAGTATD